MEPCQFQRLWLLSFFETVQGCKCWDWLSRPYWRDIFFVWICDIFFFSLGLVVLQTCAVTVLWRKAWFAEIMNIYASLRQLYQGFSCKSFGIDCFIVDGAVYCRYNWRQDCNFNNFFLLDSKLCSREDVKGLTTHVYGLSSTLPCHLSYAVQTLGPENPLGHLLILVKIGPKLSNLLSSVYVLLFFLLKCILWNSFFTRQ